MTNNEAMSNDERLDFLRQAIAFAEWSSGRDASYLAPPAQNRTGGFPAYGSHLGCVTAKRSLGQG